VATLRFCCLCVCSVIVHCPFTAWGSRQNVLKARPQWRVCAVAYLLIESEREVRSWHAPPRRMMAREARRSGMATRHNAAQAYRQKPSFRRSADVRSHAGVMPQRISMRRCSPRARPGRLRAMVRRARGTRGTAALQRRAPRRAAVCAAARCCAVCSVESDCLVWLKF